MHSVLPSIKSTRINWTLRGLISPWPLTRSVNLRSSILALASLSLVLRKIRSKKKTGETGEEEDCEESTLMTMRLTDKKLQNHVTLLYWKKEDKEHYAWVKSLNRLLSRLNKHNGQTYFCKRCFQGFVCPGLLQKHEEMCRHFPA